MKNKRMYGIVALATMALLLVGGVNAFGFGFGNSLDLSEEEQTEMQAFHDQVQNAIENEDFETWQTLMESQLTEENFEKVVERHQVMSEAKTIRQEIRVAMEDGDSETAQELHNQLRELMPEEKGFRAQGMKMNGFGGQGNCGFAE